MAVITLIKGGTFIGDVINYDWKGKFLVVERKPHKVVIHWDNVESVMVGDKEEVSK